MTQCKEGRGWRWDMATSIYHGLPKKSIGVSKSLTLFLLWLATSHNSSSAPYLLTRSWGWHPAGYCKEHWAPSSGMQCDLSGKD